MNEAHHCPRLLVELDIDLIVQFCYLVLFRPLGGVCKLSQRASDVEFSRPKVASIPSASPNTHSGPIRCSQQCLVIVTCSLSLPTRPVETVIMESGSELCKLSFLSLCEMIQVPGKRISIGAVAGDLVQFRAGRRPLRLRGRLRLQLCLLLCML